jgi:hypothetical protein
LGAAGGEELAFGVVAGQEQCFVVGKARLVVAVEAAEAFGPGGGEVVVSRKLRFGREGVQGGQAGRNRDINHDRHPIQVSADQQTVPDLLASS